MLEPALVKLGMRGRFTPSLFLARCATAQPLQVQISYGGSMHALGSVSGLETREFTIARRVIAGYYQFWLLATPYGSGDSRESEPFALNGAHMVEWNVDGRHLRSVTLR